MRWLTHDWDSRDPSDDLHDIETGKFLSALDGLTSSQHQMLDDNDMRVELAEIGDTYHVVKIVKKREPEFLQGKENFFIFDDDGKRIPLTEGEYNHLLGLRENADDVFNSEEVQLETLGSEYTAPLDTWDVLFDGTQYLQAAKQFVDKWNAGKVNKKETPDPVKHLEELQDELMYSADWFPYPVDKNLHSDKAKQVAADILDGRITTKQQLGAALGPRFEEKRLPIIKSLRVRAQNMKPGREKAKLLIQAQRIHKQVMNDQKRGYPFQRHLTLISDSDRNKLWALWRLQMMRETDGVELMQWQFERAYRIKLKRLVLVGDLTVEEANQKLYETTQRVYSAKTSARVGMEEKTKMPQWLLDNHLPDDVSSEDEFIHTDWLDGPVNIDSLEQEIRIED